MGSRGDKKNIGNLGVNKIILIIMIIMIFMLNEKWINIIIIFIDEKFRVFKFRRLFEKLEVDFGFIKCNFVEDGYLYKIEGVILRLRIYLSIYVSILLFLDVFFYSIVIFILFLLKIYF